MKIIRLTASNFKRLDAVEIEPDGSMTVIGGRNAQGKTSILDAIEAVLGGKRHIPKRPVHDGEEKARIVCDLDDIKVTRTFTANGGGGLKVESKDGAAFGTPQKMLDKLIGKLSFDPLEFVRMDGKARLNMLKRLVGLNFEEQDAARQAAYDDRRDIGRDVKTLEGQLDGLPHYPDAPDEKVDIAGLMAEIDAIRQHSADKNQVADRIQTVEDRIEAGQGRLKSIEAKQKALDAEAVQCHDDIAKYQEAKTALRAEYDDLGPDRDDEKIRDQIDGAQESNRQVDANDRREEVADSLKKKKRRVEKLTDQIEKIDSKRRKAIAAAKFPVDGLGFDLDGVSFNGIPFDQASSAEQLRVSVAMGLALNPKLQVLLIRDGSLLDEDSLRALGEMAEEADAQIWLERVGTDDTVGVVIEDGRVVGADESEQGGGSDG